VTKIIQTAPRQNRSWLSQAVCWAARLAAVCSSAFTRSAFAPDRRKAELQTKARDLAPAFWSACATAPLLLRRAVSKYENALPKAVSRPLSDFGFRIWRTPLLVLLAFHSSMAQLNQSATAPYNRNSDRGEGWFWGASEAKTAREAPWRSTPIPTWENPPLFSQDLFTFARVRYTRQSRSRTVWWNGGFWYSDYPDSDLNLSYRLQQMTSLKVDPNGRVIDLTDKELANYPWIYMVEPGLMVLEDAEVIALRNYLSNGGFLMADDFWGIPQWTNFEREMKRVFPALKWVELDTDHPLFSTVYKLKVPKEKLQVPNVRIGRRLDPELPRPFGFEETEIGPWETHEGEVCKDIHFRALFDSKGRLMVMACFNTDNGDGWEREGEDVYFFHRFSENIAYPLAINIIVYSMTH
jgi:hypothetical protein